MCSSYSIARAAVVAAVAIGASSGTAAADPARAVLAGLEVRPGYAVRFARPSVGLRAGDLAYRVVADPLALSEALGFSVLLRVEYAAAF